MTTRRPLPALLFVARLLAALVALVLAGVPGSPLAGGPSFAMAGFPLAGGPPFVAVDSPLAGGRSFAAASSPLAGGPLIAAAGEPTASPSQTQAVGVTLNAGPGGEAAAYRDFVAAGASALEAPQPWSTLEPAPGRFHLGDVIAIVRGVESTPATRVMLIPAAIETTERSVPADLVQARWDSPRMIGRYRRLLRRLAPHLSRQVSYASIANEADAYFASHPDELPAFLRFARIEIAALQRLAPWVKVGVTVTYGGLTSAHPFIARTLSHLGDAEIATYYPLVDGYRMRPPRAPLHDIPQMVRLAGGRPLVIQEAGYSSAPRLGGSPASQATFVDSVFAAARRFPRTIPFLSFYTLFDLPGSACRDGTDVVTFLCSLGLRRRDGRPKPAWSAFLAGIRSMSRN